MVRKLSFILAAAISLFAVAMPSAWAADTDLPVDDGVRDWSGFYVGVAGGGVGGGADFAGVGKKGDLDIDSTGLSGSALAGYNFTSNGFMLGVEADISKIDISKSFAVTGLGTVKQDADWLGSVALRGGYAWDSVMLYGTGGVALTDMELTSSLGGKSDRYKAGLVVGVGAEVAFDENWSARAEVLGYAFEGKGTFGGAKRDVDAGFGIARIGVTRKF